MGLFSGGLIIGRIFASKNLGGLFSGGLILLLLLFFFGKRGGGGRLLSEFYGMLETEPKIVGCLQPWQIREIFHRLSEGEHLKTVFLLTLNFRNLTVALNIESFPTITVF